MRGASAFIATSVRKSNDCTITRASRRWRRTLAASRRANSSGEGVNSGRSAKILVSTLNWNFPSGASASTSSSVGMRVPGTAFCFGNSGFARAPQSHCRSSSSVSRRITAPGFGPAQIFSLMTGSCETTSTSSLVTARSSSIASVPASMACRKAGSVFSGSTARAPRWPCTSTRRAGWAERTIIGMSIAAARTSVILSSSSTPPRGAPFSPSGSSWAAPERTASPCTARP